MEGARATLVGLLLALMAAIGANAERTGPGAQLSIDIHRIDAEIQIDGRLDEAVWQQAATVSTWFETRPGDNVEPQVPSLAYLAYDDLFLYAAFEFGDPEPERIRAPLANRDNVPSYTDYGGLIIDANNDGRTAQMFLANARGIQYDALSNDASGEDSSPDFFWDSAARITETGWMLEMRIPFSSLRYTDSDPEQWGIMLYRNHPREFRYQIFTSRLPRDSTCFICNVKPLTGLSGLPSGGHWVVAPYISGNQAAEPRDGLGTPLASGSLDGEVVPTNDLRSSSPSGVRSSSRVPICSGHRSGRCTRAPSPRRAGAAAAPGPSAATPTPFFSARIAAVAVSSFPAPTPPSSPSDSRS